MIIPCERLCKDCVCYDCECHGRCDTSYGAGYDNGYENAESAEREWWDA